MENIHSEGCLLCVLTSHVSRTPIREPKPTKHFGFHKFVSSILSDVEKFTEVNGAIIFQIPAKMLPENICDMAVSI